MIEPANSSLRTTCVIVALIEGHTRSSDRGLAKEIRENPIFNHASLLNPSHTNMAVEFCVCRLLIMVLKCTKLIRDYNERFFLFLVFQDG